MNFGTVCALSAIVALAGMPPQKPGKQPSSLRGTIRSVEGNLIVLDAPGAGAPNGRQVDITSAMFERADGKRVPRFHLNPRDTVVVIVDPNAPTEYRPKPQPGRPMPMFIRLLPLKALVVKRIQSASIDPNIKP